MEAHLAATIFPLLGSEALARLGDDIAEHGLRDAIEVFEGKILDGRNRYNACLSRGVEPRFVSVETPDPFAYVVSKNLHRRHLDESQRALCAARAKSMFEAAARERMRRGKEDPVANLPQGKSRDQAAALMAVSPRSVEHASRVLRSGSPELVAAVESGEVSVSRASSVAALPAEEQAPAARERAPRATVDRVGKALELVAAMTPSERDSFFRALQISGAIPASVT